jgi:hypothetical protein
MIEIRNLELAELFAPQRVIEQRRQDGATITASGGGEYGAKDGAWPAEVLAITEAERATLAPKALSPRSPKARLNMTASGELTLSLALRAKTDFDNEKAWPDLATDQGQLSIGRVRRSRADSFSPKSDSTRPDRTRPQHR